MRDLPRGARFYIALVFSMGAFTALVSLLALSINLDLLLQALLLTAIIAILDLYPVIIRKDQIEVLISSAVKLAAVFLVSAPVLLFATFFGTLVSEWRMPRAWYKKIFNTGALTVTYTILAAVFQFLRQPGVPDLTGSPQNLLALAAVGGADIVVNGGLIALAIALASNMPVSYVWSENFKPIIWHDLSMLPLGVSIAVLWHVSPIGVALVSIPLMVVRHSYQTNIALQRQTAEALFALARVLDERDEATSRHSELVAQHARETAHELGLSPAEVDVIERAAWLHDIGKVGMRESILLKPGPLTKEERELATRHASIGGDLLEKFPLFERGAIYVRHHHERWDGTGYPDRLRGERIPLGARILAVADAYQAMIEERPYRGPLTPEATLEQLLLGSGTQFDARVVQALIRAKGLFKKPAEVEAERATLSPAEPAAVAAL